jgi:predicted small secreted protein
MKSVLIVAAFAVTMALAACNTVQGAGKDVQSLGSAIEKVASPKAPAQ